MTAAASPDSAPVPAPAKRDAPPIMTGSGQILASLEKLGVTDVFGIPGGAIMPFYDELMASTSIRHILVRHEQGAGHAAEGYAAASGTGRRRDRDLRSRSHQPRHRDRGCAHGLGADDRDHRAGVLDLDGHRRVPGGRHRRHHDADHEALVPRHRPGRRAGDARRGVPDRDHRSTRSRARRCDERRPAEVGARSSGRPRSTCPATGR